MQPKFHLAQLLFVLVAFAPSARCDQPQIMNLSRESNAVSFVSRDGYGPYLVRTSADLFNWSDQGDPEVRTNWTLPAFSNQSYYRVTDLNASNLYGDLFGLIQTDQGEIGSLLARHRLKTRLWLYKTKGPPHTAATYKPTNYWGKLLVNLQTHWNGEVQTWTGALENLGQVTTPGNSNQMTITWTNGFNQMQRTFTLTFEFPYSVSATRNNAGRTRPNASDPIMTLKCAYATSQPELDWNMAFIKTNLDTVTLLQMDPGNKTNTDLPVHEFRVSTNKVQIQVKFLEGLPLYQGSPPFIYKTLPLDRWLAPTVAEGGSLPSFSTDSYFARTLLPGHHNFYEIVLIEPALDPALSEATRQALLTANIRYVYCFKDIAIGMSPDQILFLGFDNTAKFP